MTFRNVLDRDALVLNICRRVQPYESKAVGSLPCEIHSVACVRKQGQKGAGAALRSASNANADRVLNAFIATRRVALTELSATCAVSARLR